MTTLHWSITPVLGVANVRRTAEYYRDVLGFTLDPTDGIFTPGHGDPGGVYGAPAGERA